MRSADALALPLLTVAIFRDHLQPAARLASGVTSLNPVSASRWRSFGLA